MLPHAKTAKTCNTDYYLHNKGSACRFEVVGWLKKKFDTPHVAEIPISYMLTTTTKAVQTDDLDAIPASRVKVEDKLCKTYKVCI